MERRRSKNQGYRIGIFVGFLEGLIMVLLRTHYFIDIVFGLMAGHYFFIWAGYLCFPLDYYLPLSTIQRERNLKYDMQAIKLFNSNKNKQQ